MRRIQIFIIVLITTIAVLLTLTLVSWYFATTSPSYYGSSWMGQMWGSHLGSSSNYGMGGMMGNGSTATPSYLWLVPVALGIAVGVAVIGVAFYYAYPELKYIRGNTTCNPVPVKTGVQTQAVETSSPVTSNANAPKVANSCDVLLKTMTPEEQKVLSVLVAHNGKYLQKYVVKESGLSRLKTHRIVARFAERGIVTVKEFGNTNEIVVSDWVKS
jgi:uncharacterized membrane protein